MRVSATLFLLLLAVIIFTIFQQRDFHRVIEKIRSQAAEAPKAESPQAVTKPASTRQVCFFCRGKGKVEFAQDSQGKHTRMYTCPVCTGAGSRDLKDKPAEAKLCPECQGMTRLPNPHDRSPDITERYTAQPCTTCNSRGWL